MRWRVPIDPKFVCIVGIPPLDRSAPTFLLFPCRMTKRTQDQRSKYPKDTRTDARFRVLDDRVCEQKKKTHQNQNVDLFVVRFGSFWIRCVERLWPLRLPFLLASLHALAACYVPFFDVDFFTTNFIYGPVSFLFPFSRTDN